MGALALNRIAGNDQADVFFARSTDGGTNGTATQRVNLDGTTNDQWMPVLAVKPDGTQLFMGWYDRRDDPTNNSLIHTYGVFADLPITNAGSFAAAFAISTVQFPPVFTGTTMTNLGQFDPVYSPKFRTDGIDCPTFNGIYASHMGDYDAAVSDSADVYYGWADNRNTSTNSTSGIDRNQADIRLIRLPWPQ